LHKQIDVAQSEVQLLVDFICVKLCKLERGVSWNQFGHDISEFTIPERTQMKSNFLKPKKQEVKEIKEDDKKDEEKEEEEEEEEEVELTEEEKVA